MIYDNNKEIDDIRHDNQVIVYVYKGLQLVWQAVNSCFGAGFWDRTKGWSRTDGWKKNI